MGGDVLAGTNFVDALKIFENDSETEGIVLIGEIGGTAELDAADWIKDYNKRSDNPKYDPLCNFIPQYLISYQQAYFSSYWRRQYSSGSSDGSRRGFHITRRT